MRLAFFQQRPAPGLRQRLRPSLEETSSVVCPRCTGQGTIRDTKSLALSVLRLVEEEAGKERSAQIRTIVPVEIATYLLNEKRRAIIDIEQRNRLHVMVIPNPNMETPHFEVMRPALSTHPRAPCSR